MYLYKYVTSPSILILRVHLKKRQKNVCAKVELWKTQTYTTSHNVQNFSQVSNNSHSQILAPDAFWSCLLPNMWKKHEASVLARSSKKREVKI